MLQLPPEGIYCKGLPQCILLWNVFQQGGGDRDVVVQGNSGCVADTLVGCEEAREVVGIGGSVVLKDSRGV